MPDCSICGKVGGHTEDTMSCIETRTMVGVFYRVLVSMLKYESYRPLGSGIYDMESTK